MSPAQSLPDHIWHGRHDVDLPSGPCLFGIALVGGIGLGTLSIHSYHLLASTEALYPLLVGTLLPIGLSSLLLAIPGGIYWRQCDAVAGRIGIWCLVGMSVLIGVSAVSITYQAAQDVQMVDPLFVVTDHATVGALIGALIGMYDGQRQQREHALQDEQERAQQLNDRLTVLNRVLRHDLRNKLTVIRGKARQLQRDEVDREEATQTIDHIAKELETIGERARQLETILDHDTKACSPVDIASFLRAKTTELTEIHQDLTVETDIPETAEVHAPLLVKDALDELVENAIEHNDADTPQLRIRVTTIPRNPEANGRSRAAVSVRIRDNGPGIPRNEIDVLERGYETALDHSSGLGLWFVHWIVSIADGELQFETNEPRGSVVELRLPAASNGDADEEESIDETGTHDHTGAFTQTD